MSKTELVIFQQLSKYAIIGVIATFIHIITAEMLIHFVIKVPLYANILAFFVALFISFLGHYHWSFSSKAHKGRAFIRFFIIALVAMLVNNALLSILLTFDWFVVDISIIVAALVVPILTFFLSRYWAFA